MSANNESRSAFLATLKGVVIIAVGLDHVGLFRYGYFGGDLSFKGCTIGSVRSGAREGVPQIGDRVVVGCNAFVCEGIIIGDDVLVVANSFVNLDVPSNSVVIGNLGKIHRKDNASINYIRRS